MTIWRNSLAIVATLALAAGEVFAAASPDIPKQIHPSATRTVRYHQPSKKKSKAKHLKTVLQPAMHVDLHTEPHYAVVVENGKMELLSKSDSFDTDKRVTAASLTKLLTADAALDKTGPVLSPEQIKLLGDGLRASKNEAIEDFALTVADPTHEKGISNTNENVLEMLRGKVQQLGLSKDQYDPANASGNPNRAGQTRRYDTFASPRAMLKVAVDLVQHHADTLDPIFCNASPRSFVTNNLFCPAGAVPTLPIEEKTKSDAPLETTIENSFSILANVIGACSTPSLKNVVESSNTNMFDLPSVTSVKAENAHAVRVYAKTGTDFPPLDIGPGQNHSMIVVITAGDKAYAFYHPHLPSPDDARRDGRPSDRRSPVSTMAAIVFQVLMEKTDIRDPAVLNLLQGDAEGKIQPNDVVTGRILPPEPPPVLVAASQLHHHVNMPKRRSRLKKHVIIQAAMHVTH